MQKQRLHIVIRGAVQGVGFRPFIYRLATDMRLAGWVVNSTQGVLIEVEGERPDLDEFILRLTHEKPPRAFIQSLEPSLLDPVGFTSFEIRESDDRGTPSALVMPDIATCPDCLREIFDPTNRRYRYPFTNCTNCGPRFTIIESLPYDRPSTTMKQFIMCDMCRKEYKDPLDRRFHAQPNACPECGPHLDLWNNQGNIIATHFEALSAAVEMIRSGNIVAVKGLGGFHLIVDARNDEAVLTLRARKHREEKPFAVMVPSLDTAKELCMVSALEERLLTSPESPIVLLQKRDAYQNFQLSTFNPKLSNAVSPGNPYLGVMLPYTPLHHMLIRELGFPIVATSGNLADEPICIDELEALERLGSLVQIADAFLVHNRPILRHVDDSIVRIMAGRELVLRRARGFAPLPIPMRLSEIPSMLAVGAHLKNTITITAGDNAFISQHIGDLETHEALTAFKNVIASLQTLYSFTPTTVVCDEHPDYLSTKHARSMGIETLPVQHHYAHIASCMAENELNGEVLGVSWDGTGYGLDGTIWGGEFLLTNETGFDRVATFRPFPLPGGDQAIREPRRTALGMLYAKAGDEAFKQNDLACVKAFTQSELSVIQTMLQKKINSPLTSSIGRLFDGVASLIGLRQQTNYEGETAMELEFATIRHVTDESYPYNIVEGKTDNLQPSTFNLKHLFYIDWFPMIGGIVSDHTHGIAVGHISTKFHNTLTEIIIAVAKKIQQQRVALSGGCFQNKYLTERTIRRLQEEGFKPYWHQRVPPNDGGISLGQIAAALRLKKGIDKLH
ncbi:MAG: carbamoyltransferase HypF [Bacteroidota bacterium]